MQLLQNQRDGPLGEVFLPHKNQNGQIEDKPSASNTIIGIVGKCASVLNGYSYKAMRAKWRLQKNYKKENNQRDAAKDKKLYLSNKDACALQEDNNSGDDYIKLSVGGGHEGSGNSIDFIAVGDPLEYIFDPTTESMDIERLERVRRMVNRIPMDFEMLMVKYNPKSVQSMIELEILGERAGTLLKERDDGRNKAAQVNKHSSVQEVAWADFEF